MVNGAVTSVSTFAGLVRGRRPECQCPVCGSRVFLKLGNERVHHFAHEPGTICALTNPETALHFNTKHYLAAELGRSLHIEVQTACIKCGKPQGETLKGWDRTLVELPIHPYRVDVGLMSGAAPIGAIEVRVTNHVDDEKVRSLAYGSLWMLEIDAKQLMETGWTSDVALGSEVLLRRHPKSRVVCDRCRSKKSVSTNPGQRRSSSAKPGKRRSSSTAYARSGGVAYGVERWWNGQPWVATHDRFLDIYSAAGRFRRIYILREVVGSQRSDERSRVLGFRDWPVRKFAQVIFEGPAGDRRQKTLISQWIGRRLPFDRLVLDDHGWGDRNMTGRQFQPGGPLRKAYPRRRYQWQPNQEAWTPCELGGRR